MLKVACLPPRKPRHAHAEFARAARAAAAAAGGSSASRATTMNGASCSRGADMALPGVEEVEPLIRREELSGLFERAPDRLGRFDVVQDIDARDPCALATTTPRDRRRGFRSPRPSSSSAKSNGHQQCAVSAAPDLCKEMSTKRNDNAGNRRAAARREGLACHANGWSDEGRGCSWPISAAWRGCAEWPAAAAGVDPAVRAGSRRRGATGFSRCDRARSRRSCSIALLRALKRWNCEVISLDEVCARMRAAQDPPAASSASPSTAATRDLIDQRLSGAGAARRAVRGVPADRVSRRRRRSVVAGAGTGDRDRRPRSRW